VNAKRHPHVLARYINDNLIGPRSERHNVKFIKLPKEVPPKVSCAAVAESQRRGHCVRARLRACVHFLLSNCLPRNVFGGFAIA
jgi:hypothetical protein